MRSKLKDGEQVEPTPGESVTLSTYCGRSGNVEDLPLIARVLTQRSFGATKVRLAREIRIMKFISIDYIKSRQSFSIGGRSRHNLGESQVWI